MVGLPLATLHDGVACLEEVAVDVGDDARRGEGDVFEQLVQLGVVAHGQVEVARVDARLLVVARRVARQLQHLGHQVLQHGRRVHGRRLRHPVRHLRALDVAVDAPHRELQPRALAARLLVALLLRRRRRHRGHHVVCFPTLYVACERTAVQGISYRALITVSR